MRGRLLLLLALAAATGCANVPSEGATVTGTIELDGQPLADASVHFRPKDDLELGIYQGRTGPDGRFHLKNRYGPLVKPGRYIVLIAREVKKDGTPPNENDDPREIATPGALRNTLPARYADRANPVFVVEVKNGENELPPFRLTRRGD